MLFKEYIAKQLIGHNLHFNCDCVFPLNCDGTIIDYEISDNEIIFIVRVGNKIMKIGENHPKLYINII